MAEKLTTKKYKTVIINLTDNETNKNKNKEIWNKQKLIERELEKYQKEKIKSNLLKNLKIKNNKEKNKINYIKNNNKKKKRIKNKINKNKLIKKYKLNINKNKILKNKKFKINKKYNNKKNNYIKKQKINNLKNILLKNTENKLIYFLNINLILKNKKFKEIKNNKEKINIIIELIKNIQKEFDYTILKIEEIKSYILKEKIIENSNKIILFVEGNYLGIKRIYNFLDKNKNNKNIEKESLHILINKTKSNNINYSIIKPIFKNYKINVNKNYKYF